MNSVLEMIFLVETTSVCRCLGGDHCGISSHFHSINRWETALWFEVNCPWGWSLLLSAAVSLSFMVCMRSSLKKR